MEEHKCLECNKTVLVARVIPCDEWEDATGMWLSRMDEYCNTETIGVLCKDCAFDMCDEGKVGLGFQGGLLRNLTLWEATITAY